MLKIVGKHHSALTSLYWKLWIASDKHEKERNPFAVVWTGQGTHLLTVCWDFQALSSRRPSLTYSLLADHSMGAGKEFLAISLTGSWPFMPTPDWCGTGLLVVFGHFGKWHFGKAGLEGLSQEAHMILFQVSETGRQALWLEQAKRTTGLVRSVSLPQLYRVSSDKLS